MASDPCISVLLDIYATVLTNKQKECLDLYYNQDFSLAEIAEYYNITRQGARDFIEKGKACLFNLENKIKILEKQKKRQEALSQIIYLSKLIKNNNSKQILNCADLICEIAKKIYDD